MERVDPAVKSAVEIVNKVLKSTHQPSEGDIKLYILIGTDGTTFAVGREDSRKPASLPPGAQFHYLHVNYTDSRLPTARVLGVESPTSKGEEVAAGVAEYLNSHVPISVKKAQDEVRMPALAAVANMTQELERDPSDWPVVRFVIASDGSVERGESKASGAVVYLDLLRLRDEKEGALQEISAPPAMKETIEYLKRIVGKVMLGEAQEAKLVSWEQGGA